MKEENIRLRIITPEGEFLRQEEVRSVYLPGRVGQTGILRHHLPLISRLQQGELHVETAGGENRYFFMSRGYAKVQDNELRVLTHSIVPGEELDPEEIRTKLQQINRGIEDAATRRVTPEQLEALLRERIEWKTKKKIHEKSGSGEN